MRPETVQSSLFRKEEGRSFAQLEDEVRLQRAFQLLRDGQLALFEVAFLLGFSDPSAFSRAFRRWSGMPPMAWQRPMGPPRSPELPDERTR